MNSSLAIFSSDFMYLKDKATTLESLIKQVRTDIARTEQTVAKTNRSIRKTNKDIEAIKKEKATISSSIETSCLKKLQPLLKAKSELEENVKVFQGRVETIKNALEKEKRLKFSLYKVLYEKDDSIKELSHRVDKLNAEKTDILAKCQQKPSRKSLSDMKKQPFVKDKIKPYPFASFQFSIDYNSERKTPTAKERKPIRLERSSDIVN